MSAVAKVSLQISGMKLPVPTTSIGAFASAITRHLATEKPDEATIVTRAKPASSSASRMCQMAAADTPVPIRWRSSSGER